MSVKDIERFDPQFAEGLQSFREDRLPLNDWKTGVEALFASLADMPTWLQFSDEEKAWVEKFRALSAGRPTPS